MTHSFEFTDEELSTLAYVLWEQDNNLAMLPPGQFTEQATQVRVVAKLAHEFEQRNRAAQMEREQALTIALRDQIADATSVSNFKAAELAERVIRMVRVHDNPPEPEAPSLPERDAKPETFKDYPAW